MSEDHQHSPSVPELINMETVGLMVYPSTELLKLEQFPLHTLSQMFKPIRQSILLAHAHHPLLPLPEPLLLQFWIQTVTSHQWDKLLFKTEPDKLTLSGLILVAQFQQLKLIVSQLPTTS